MAGAGRRSRSVSPRRRGEAEVAGHLASLVPRDGPHGFPGQCGNGPAHGFLDGDRAMVIREVEQERGPRRPLDEGVRCAGTVPALDQVALLALLPGVGSLQPAFVCPSGCGYGSVVSLPRGHFTEDCRPLPAGGTTAD
jgi:hypothetical protein